VLLDEHGGDLRRLRAAADGDVGELSRRLQEFKGIGEVGAEIFLREVQAIWPEVRPHVVARARAGAAALGLPSQPEELAELVDGDDLAR
jgi:hypothetical protein